MYDIYPKDPDEVVDFTVDWSTPLGSTLVLDESQWTAPGLTIADSSATDTAATVRLSGGVAGNDYVVTNRATLSDGQVWEQSIIVTVTER